MPIVVLGIDLGKNSCSVVGLDAGGRVVLRRRPHRDGVVKGLPSCVVVMEACCGAHHLGRTLSAQGHRIRLMSPETVWMTLADRCPAALDDQVLGAAAGLAGMALGQGCSRSGWPPGMDHA